MKIIKTFKENEDRSCILFEKKKIEGKLFVSKGAKHILSYDFNSNSPSDSWNVVHRIRPDNSIVMATGRVVKFFWIHVDTISGIKSRQEWIEYEIVYDNKIGFLKKNDLKSARSFFKKY